MALRPDSDQPGAGTTPEYGHDHPDPDDSPEAWGWHGEWGRSARVAGWITAAILLIMTTATHYNGAGLVWLIVFAAAIVGTLLWDINRRRSSWRQ